MIIDTIVMKFCTYNIYWKKIYVQYLSLLNYNFTKQQFD